MVIGIWLFFGACIFGFGACPEPVEGVQVNPAGQLLGLVTESPLDLKYASVAGPGARSEASWAVDTEPPEDDWLTVGKVGVCGIDGVFGVQGVITVGVMLEGRNVPQFSTLNSVVLASSFVSYFEGSVRVTVALSAMTVHGPSVTKLRFGEILDV